MTSLIPAFSNNNLTISSLIHSPVQPDSSHQAASTAHKDNWSPLLLTKRLISSKPSGNPIQPSKINDISGQVLRGENKGGSPAQEPPEQSNAEQPLSRSRRSASRLSFSEQVSGGGNPSANSLPCIPSKTDPIVAKVVSDILDVLNQEEDKFFLDLLNNHNLMKRCELIAGRNKEVTRKNSMVSIALLSTFLSIKSYQIRQIVTHRLFKEFEPKDIVTMAIRLGTDTPRSSLAQETYDQLSEAKVIVNGRVGVDHVNKEALGDFHEWIMQNCNEETLHLKGTKQTWKFKRKSNQEMDIRWEGSDTIEGKEKVTHLNIKLTKKGKHIKVKHAEIFFPDDTVDYHLTQKMIDTWLPKKTSTGRLKSQQQINDYFNVLNEQYKSKYPSLLDSDGNPPKLGGRFFLPDPLSLDQARPHSVETCLDLEYALLKTRALDSSPDPEGQWLQYVAAQEEAEYWLIGSKEVSKATIEQRMRYLTDRATLGFHEPGPQDGAKESVDWSVIRRDREFGILGERIKFLKELKPIAGKPNIPEKQRKGFFIKGLFTLASSASWHQDRFFHHQATASQLSPIDKLIAGNPYFSAISSISDSLRDSSMNQGVIPKNILGRKDIDLLPIFYSLDTGNMENFQKQFKTAEELIQRETLAPLSPSEKDQLSRFKSATQPSAPIQYETLLLNDIDLDPDRFKEKLRQEGLDIESQISENQEETTRITGEQKKVDQDIALIGKLEQTINTQEAYIPKSGRNRVQELLDISLKSNHQFVPTHLRGIAEKFQQMIQRERSDSTQEITIQQEALIVAEARRTIAEGKSKLETLDLQIKANAAGSKLQKSRLTTQKAEIEARQTEFQTKSEIQTKAEAEAEIRKIIIKDEVAKRINIALIDAQNDLFGTGRTRSSILLENTSTNSRILFSLDLKDNIVLVFEDIKGRHLEVTEGSFRWSSLKEVQDKSHVLGFNSFLRRKLFQFDFSSDIDTLHVKNLQSLDPHSKTEINNLLETPLQTDLDRLKLETSQKIRVQTDERTVVMPKHILYQMGTSPADLLGKTQIDAARLNFDYKNVISTMLCEDTVSLKDIDFLVSKTKMADATSLGFEGKALVKGTKKHSKILSGPNMYRFVGSLGQSRAIFDLFYAGLTNNHEAFLLGSADLALSTAGPVLVTRLAKISNKSRLIKAAPIAGEVVSSVMGVVSIIFSAKAIQENPNNSRIIRDSGINIGFTTTGIFIGLGTTTAMVAGASAAGPVGLLVGISLQIVQGSVMGGLAIRDAVEDLHAVSGGEKFSLFFSGFFGLRSPLELELRTQQVWQQAIDKMIAELKKYPEVEIFVSSLSRVGYQYVTSPKCHYEYDCGPPCLAGMNYCKPSPCTSEYICKDVTEKKIVREELPVKINLLATFKQRLLDRSYPGRLVSDSGPIPIVDPLSPANMDPICLPTPLVNDEARSKKSNQPSYECDNAVAFKKTTQPSHPLAWYNLRGESVSVMADRTPRKNLLSVHSKSVNINVSKGQSTVKLTDPLVKGAIHAHNGTLFLPETSRSGTISSSQATYSGGADLTYSGMTGIIGTSGSENVIATPPFKAFDGKGGTDYVNAENTPEFVCMIHPGLTLTSGEGRRVYIIKAERPGKALIHLHGTNTKQEFIFFQSPPSAIRSIKVTTDKKLYQPPKELFKIELSTPRGSFTTSFSKPLETKHPIERMKFLFSIESPVKTEGQLVLKRVEEEKLGTTELAGHIEAKIENDRQLEVWAKKTSFPCIKLISQGTKRIIFIEDYGFPYSINRKDQRAWSTMQIKVNNHKQSIQSVILILHLDIPMEIEDTSAQSSSIEIVLPKEIISRVAWTRENNDLILRLSSSQGSLKLKNYLSKVNQMSIVDTEGKSYRPNTPSIHVEAKKLVAQKTRILDLDALDKCGWHIVPKKIHHFIDRFRIAALSFDHLIVHKRGNDVIFTSKPTLAITGFFVLEGFYETADYRDKVIEINNETQSVDDLIRHQSSSSSFDLQEASGLWTKLSLELKTYTLMDHSPKCENTLSLNNPDLCQYKKLVLKLEEDPKDLNISYDYLEDTLTFSAHGKSICFKNAEERSIDEIQFVNHELSISLVGIPPKQIPDYIQPNPISYASKIFPQVLSRENEAILQNFLVNPDDLRGLPGKIPILDVTLAIANLISRRILEGKPIEFFFSRKDTLSEQTIRNKVQDIKTNFLRLREDCNSSTPVPPKCSNTTYNKTMRKQLVHDLSDPLEKFMANTILGVPDTGGFQAMTSNASGRPRVGFPLSLLSKVFSLFPR